MHTVLAALKFVGIAIVAAAAFYGLYRFAKARGAFDTTPPSTPTRGGTDAGAPKPK